MRIEVRVPTLSDSVASGTLLPWRRQVGDTVARDETLVDLETDKVILEIPAPASGTLVEIIRAEGESVKAEEVIAVIETGEGLSAVEPEPEKTPVATRAASSPLRGKGRGEGKKAARSPGVRTLSPSQASERGQVAGNPQASQSVGLGAALFPSPAGGRGQGEGIGEGANVMPTPIKREPMSRLRQRIAERLVAAQRTAALLTTFNEVNMAPVNALRQRYKAEFEVKHGVKLGYMSFFVRAVCGALQQLPVVNAAIDGNDIVWHADADIGIAISTPRGLVVPILRHAQTLSAADIERAIADFASRAVDNRLTLEELAGGTFSITNGGVFGSLLSTPILNPPQSAILGMHAIQERPIAEHGQVVVRPMMYLALTYDHRLIDGRDAVQFLVAVKNALETPDVLLGEV